VDKEDDYDLDNEEFLKVLVENLGKNKTNDVDAARSDYKQHEVSEFEEEDDYYDLDYTKSRRY
jgi:hypothetical protein